MSIGSEAVYAVERLREIGNRPDRTGTGEMISLVYRKWVVVVSVDPRRVYIDPKYDGPSKSEVCPANLVVLMGARHGGTSAPSRVGGRIANFVETG